MLPVVTVLAAATVLWYAAALWMNADQAAALAPEGASQVDILRAALDLDRPLLPAPHQVAAEMIDGVFDHPVTSVKSLIYHAGVTAGAAALGFALALVLGLALAVGIVHVRTLDRSLMPWIDRQPDDAGAGDRADGRRRARQCRRHRGCCRKR